MKRVCLAAVSLLFGSTIAHAHALLEHANPGAGAVVSPAPKGVTLDFSEGLEPSFSTVAVTNAAGQSVTSAPSAASGTQMQVTLKPLGPGTYRVTWHALSVDTHRTQGSFVFTIKR
ncbi:MAG TPA: copper homeostasis periplasmic binding protein CopC [Rhizomicrobium sp.]|jgi:hypothetical protein